MSYPATAAWRSDARETTTYVMRGSGGGGDSYWEYPVAEQFPADVLYRVRCSFAANANNSITSTGLVELRLYNAVSTERIYDATVGGAPGYYVCGWLRSARNTNTLGGCDFTPSPTLFCRTMNSGVWRLVFYDLSTSAVMTSTTITNFVLVLQARVGGKEDDNSDLIVSL